MGKTAYCNMANKKIEIESEIKSLVISALIEKNLNDYNIDIVGTSNKGDGFIGDIYFVNLTSTIKNYNFVLKCGKPSEALRKTVPVKDAFDHEIYMYRVVLPKFKGFELEQNMYKVLNTIPKCYGTFTCQGKEVIVLQNLKTIGYELWDKKLPLPRSYIETVLKQYGRLHAISAAMQDQQPAIFGKLIDNMLDVWGTFCSNKKYCNVFISTIEYIEKIWENGMEENVLNAWKKLKNYTEFYIVNLRKKSKSLNVINHGDGWNNNFMFKITNNGKFKKVNVALLDWQISSFSSPVIDISFFLYACASQEDLENFDDLLKFYYDSFAKHLTRLGSDPKTIYTFSNLLDDWKIYGIYGIIHAFGIFRILGSDTDDIIDIAEAAESGDAYVAFCTTISDIDYIKQRTKHIILHAVERDLIESIKYF